MIISLAELVASKYYDRLKKEGRMTYGGGVRINFVMVKISMDKNDIQSMLLMFMFKSLINKQL